MTEQDSESSQMDVSPEDIEKGAPIQTGKSWELTLQLEEFEFST